MKKRALAAIVILVAAFALYAPTIHDYFTQDDFGVVGLFSQRSLAYFPRWFVSPWTENIWGYVPDEIRPFPAASYVIASWFGRAAPEPNHVANIALHAVNGLLVMWIAEAAAGLSLIPAAFAGVVFVLLPIQAESVAWVTGRVDSLPAFFYFASFLLYVRSVRLRPDTTDISSVRLQADAGVRRLQADYWLSVALFFCALFSKQNTITMVPALAAFDVLMRREDATRAGWARWALRYVPYIVLTVGFLALRFALFHEVARESVLNAERVREFLSDSSRHLVRLVFAGPGVRHWTWPDTAWVAAGVFAVVLAGTKRKPMGRAIFYFGPIWIALGMAPILVSGYYSPRHMYLASLGWAIVLGAALEMLWYSPAVKWRRIAAGLAAMFVVAAYGSQLHGVVRDWNRYAAISRQALTQIELEASSDPDGTLIIAGVPRLSWAFAVPHSVRPPFTPTDLTKQVFVISDSSDHCCNAVLWNDYTRAALRAWRDRPDRPPVIALYWNPTTSRMSRVSDRDDAQLRTLASLLLDTRDRASLDSVIGGLLNDYVALR
jgi:hypothetical protein